MSIVTYRCCSDRDPSDVIDTVSIDQSDVVGAVTVEIIVAYKCCITRDHRDVIDAETIETE